MPLSQRAQHEAPPPSDVITWRSAQLTGAGFDPAAAGRLAADPRWDLHAILSSSNAAAPRRWPCASSLRTSRPRGADEPRPPTGAAHLPAVAAAGGPDLGDARATENAQWLSALRSAGPVGEEALDRLHALLLRAARFEVGRRRGALTSVASFDLDDLAVQGADDALVTILDHLDDFRGESRLTTWAYKFAIYETSVKLRRRAWHGREVSLEPESWAALPDAGGGPEARAEYHDLVRLVREGITSALTPHQRHILVALALNGVPIDVLADRLGATRGSLYKTLHDARVKLRAHLATSGMPAPSLRGEASR